MVTRSSSTKRIGAALVLFGLLAPASAHAGVERIAIHYETSSDCPSEPDFLATVRSYTTRWVHVQEGDSASRTIGVRISVGPTETTGRLAVANVGGSLSQRTIVGPSCSEVSRALAVMVAVTIDPRAGRARPEAEPNALPVEAPSGAVPQPTPLEPSSPPALPSGDRTPPKPRAKRVPQASTPPRVALDLRVETTSAVLRGGLHVIGASVAIEPGWLRSWRPSFGIGLRQSLPDERSFRGGSVDLSWTAANVRLCPVRISVASLVEISPCAESNVGVLRADADGFVVSRRVSSAWLDVGASAWATVPLSQRVFFSSTMLVTQPIVRHPIALSSGAPVASVPPFGVLVGVGLGMKM